MKRIPESDCWITSEGVAVTQWGNPIKTYTRKDGYVQVGFKINGKWITRTLHRLVAAAYLGLDLNDRTIQVNHKNLNKSDNHPSNLELCSAGYNTGHYHTANRPNDNDETLECRKCGSVLPHESFNKCSAKKHGRNPVCKVCLKAARQKEK